MATTLTQSLGAFSYGLRYEDLPAEVVEKCKTLIMHGVGVGLSGFDTEIGQMGVEVAKKMADGAPGHATILVDGSKVSPAAAAFANATICHSIAEEDFFAEGYLHPGVCAIPVILAIGEASHSTGKAVIAATAASYEIGARTSEHFARLGVGRGFRSTTVYGPMIAATAAAKLLDMSESQTVIALGWGANLAFGLLEWGLAKSFEMPLQNGYVCSNGIIAAYLGQSGAVSAPTILEGDKGLYKVFDGTRENLDRVTDGIGKTYKMMATELKRNPAGAHSQTAALAMLQLVRGTEINPAQIEKIKVRLNPEETGYPGFKSMLPGITNVRYLLAIGALEKKLTLSSLALRSRPEVTDLMAKVDVIDDESVPVHSCKLAVVLNNGKTVTKDLDMGGGKWLFSLREEAEWQRKELLPEMAIEPDKARQMIDMVTSLETCRDFSQIMPVLTSPGRKSKRLKIVM